MDKVKITAVLAVLVMVIAGAAIAIVKLNKDNNNSDDNESTNESYFPVTVTDYLGREVTIESADRIVSVSAVPTSILCGLGVSSQIVGVSSDSGVYSEDSSIIGMTDDDFPQAIVTGINNGTITALGGMYHMSAETITSVESDLVVCDNYGTNQDIRDALDALGVTYIVVSSSSSVQEIYDNIELLGKAVGKESKAETMVSEMESSIEKICTWCESIVTTKLHGEKYSVALMMTAKYAVGPSYLGGVILSGLCVDNSFSEIGKYAQVTSESIAAKDPDVIIYQNLGMGDGVTDPAAYIASLYSDPVLGNISAAENGLIFGTSGAAKNAASYADQGIVRAYAMYAMFIYQDYLTFEIPDVLDGSNYSQYLSLFWDMINS